MNSSDDVRLSRRELCRSSLRWAALEGLGLVSLRLIVTGSSADRCPVIACRDCGAFGSCTLPQARAAKVTGTLRVPFGFSGTRSVPDTIPVPTR
jgi:hypothetical protein